jgi:hypothetical protein
MSCVSCVGNGAHSWWFMQPFVQAVAGLHSSNAAAAAAAAAQVR